MSNHNDRELSLYMAQILDQTDRRADTVELMNHVVDLNPQLTSEERNLLSASYKSVISVHRNGLRILSAISQHEEGVATQHRIEQIKIIRQTIIDDLEKSCNELINMINEKLLPVTQDAEARIFYSKLLADYYRYMCEARTDDKRKEYAEEAKKCYESALDIAKTELRPFKPASLGLILNYSVFLQEILGDTEAALDLAQKTYSECTPLIEENSDNSYSEATMILQLLRDNILLWSDNQAK
ncbi:14-3-3 protein [Tritrichomonas foetus]|uniref:14-3-3 protein n=1 Tax=Tritrichomonas foetus TaxID=1144522 RepID=A0A1J4J8Y8_9EUKA|nr:14-3-3 protein [Tritrichomonas foetus]|eukprot:OHS95650.1 14-3-3 protein [Tritrichomonas foetus]